MIDNVYTEFLSNAAREAARCRRDSRILTLTAVPASGNPPASYLAVYHDIAHFEPAAGGTVGLSARSIPVVIHFPADYLRSVDPTLQFRVGRVNAPILHPNCRADGTLCLGNRFRPGTSLRALLETIHGVLSYRIVATDNAFDPMARDYFLDHIAEVRGLRDRAPSLWNRPVAAKVRREGVDDSEHAQGARR